MQIDLLPIGDINPSTYNPRVADPARLDLIELSLRKLGFLLPIYADPAGEIVSGHQRHHVAQRLGYTRLPVARTRPMELAERKAVNVLFNRGTNDLHPSDTPDTMAAALASLDLPALAYAVPDKAPDSADAFRCLTPELVPIRDLLDANAGRWIEYAAGMARTLKGKGIHMPVIATRNGRVTNGIGRLMIAGEAGQGLIPVVWVTDAEAALSDAMLNRLSMDFDIHNRYRDLLRHNSFRRARRVRDGLGLGFTYFVAPKVTAGRYDIAKPALTAQWKRLHGGSIIDFGAGHLQETRLLESVGVRVSAFEPYRLGQSQQIDKAESLTLARAFLADVAAGVDWSSVFISSVLNSVPFREDREHVACLTAALCGPRTRLYACASSVEQQGWQSVNGAHYLFEQAVRSNVFRLQYEPGITLGDFQDKPKVQKFHTPEEFYALFRPFFGTVSVSSDGNNVYAACANALPPDPARLAEALRFEFDLPYPDGSRLGLVEDALAAFSARLGLPLTHRGAA
jgi:hypothetical protein